MGQTHNALLKAAPRMNIIIISYISYSTSSHVQLLSRQTLAAILRQ